MIFLYNVLKYVFADNCLYVHGGIDKVGSTNPLNGLYKMDLETGIWEQVRFVLKCNIE